MFRNKYACRIAENVSLGISFDRIDFSDRNVRTGSRDSSRRINDQTFSLLLFRKYHKYISFISFR